MPFEMVWVLFRMGVVICVLVVIALWVLSGIVRVGRR